MKVKFLILDDEKQITKVFSLLMQQSAYDVESFEDPESALAAISKDPGSYDVILSDIRMPKMDGITFAKKVRSLHPTLPIIFMTGYPVNEVQEGISKLENVILLQKPFPLKETLEKLLPKLLEKKK